MPKESRFTPPRGMDVLTYNRGGGCKTVRLEDSNDSYANAVMCPREFVAEDGQTVRTMQIDWMGVREDMRGKGVSTYLTEQMAWQAENEGRALQSDWLRSAERDSFWKKQLRKGRVAHVLKNRQGEESYVLSLPAPASLDGQPRSVGGFIGRKVGK